MPRLRNYRLFISHAWKYKDDYDKLTRMLNDTKRASSGKTTASRYSTLLITQRTTANYAKRWTITFVRLKPF